MSGADLTVILVMAGLISLAVIRIRKDRKAGRKCPGCGGCPMSGSCSGSNSEGDGPL